MAPLCDRWAGDQVFVVVPLIRLQKRVEFSEFVRIL